MKNKLVDLKNLIKLVDNEPLSETYVRYLCGINKDREYRHSEILDINKLILNLKVDGEDLNNFIYSYIVPQLNKEFDLLKITDDKCINIELKNKQVSEEKIKKQLEQNVYYLKMLNKQTINLYTYVSETETLYKLVDNKLLQCDFSELSETLKGTKGIYVDLDSQFTPNKILVSPLNSPEKFLAKQYLLTENQKNIKNKIINYIISENDARFIGLTGGPGTGKTLLLYDIAVQLSEKYKVLLIHSGILCEGHNVLNANCKNIQILAAKELRERKIPNVDIIIVDESQRLYFGTLTDIEEHTINNNGICIFSYDNGQKLSKAEYERNTSDKIAELCKNSNFKLTNKIRTNKEIALFITCLCDLSKYRDEYVFNNVEIIYEPNKKIAVELAVELEKTKNYTFISYTASRVSNYLNYQKTDRNTHTVIGQEFDNVCMILNDWFYYDGSKLVGYEHPNPDYIFIQLLYQGLTRVRSKLAIIITEIEILQKVLQMFDK